MYLFNRLALILVLGGALFFGLRDGGEEALNGNPEAILNTNVDRLDSMINGETEVAVSEPLGTSLTYAEGVSDDVAGLAD
jgi:hypothetical protein